MIDRPHTRTPALREILAKLNRRLSLFAVFLAGATLLFTGYMVIRGHAEQNLQLVAQTASYSVEPAVVFGDRAAVRDALETVSASNIVDSIEVFDADGRLLESWARARTGGWGNVERITANVLGPGAEIANVVVDGQHIAQVRVRGGGAAITRYVFSGAIISLACLGLAFIAAMILGRRLQDAVIQPLDRASEVAHVVRTQRDFHKRVPKPGIAEVDRFVEDFNSLLKEMEEWHTGLTRENRELNRRATFDQLTGLGNRSYFEQRLAATLEGARQASAQFAVLYVDANNFKQVNDRYGHGAGDATLRVIADRLRLGIRQTDEAFRLGGDEFAIILMPFAGEVEVESVIRRLAGDIALPIALAGTGEIAVSLSVGSACFPEDGTTPSELISVADAAMYRQKNQGRNNGND